MLLGITLFGPGAATELDREEGLGIVDGLSGVFVLGLRELHLHRRNGIGAHGADEDVLTTAECLGVFNAFAENHFLSEEAAAGVLAGSGFLGKQHDDYPFQILSEIGII